MKNERTKIILVFKQTPPSHSPVTGHRRKYGESVTFRRSFTRYVRNKRRPGRVIVYMSNGDRPSKFVEIKPTNLIFLIPIRYCYFRTVPPPPAKICEATVTRSYRTRRSVTPSF